MEKIREMKTSWVVPNREEVSRMSVQYGCNHHNTNPMRTEHISHLHIHEPSFMLLKVVVL